RRLGGDSPWAEHLVLGFEHVVEHWPTLADLRRCDIAVLPPARQRFAGILPGMRRYSRRIFRAFGYLTALLVVLLAGAYLYLRQSLPTTEGEIRMAGLTAPVEILRDRYGIPHIFAASLEDASFATGYVHAQDRLWQMEMSRRIAAGRVSEIVGAGGLEADRFLRTLGVRRSAEANLRTLDAETRKQLDAYAAGVNAFLAAGPVLPPEFWLTGARPEPWTPADSVSWIKMMAWDL